MLTVELNLVVKPEKLQEFLRETAPVALPDTRSWEGNEGLILWSDRQDPRRISLRMDWRSLRDFDKYLEWRTSTGFLDGLRELTEEPPVWRYWEREVQL